MKHLIVSREYPPAPGGGIGTYVSVMAAALAARGETVHVIAQRWGQSARAVDVHFEGRLTIHRVPFTAPGSLIGMRRDPALVDRAARALFRSATPAMAFAWQAAAIAEELIGAGEVDIIEGQEYEAPLYFLQQRRAAGEGPARTPPIIVHLHSPTAFIAEHNRWPPDDRGVRMLSRLERLSVLAADGLVAPSRYLAGQVAATHALDPDAIDVIPYPLATGAPLERDAAVWRAGSVLYMGRLEPRKGAEEWLDAVGTVAAGHPDTHFVFAGSDVLEPRASSRIPTARRDRVTLAGHLDRPALGRAIANARLVVVPSRWDNYPYTCMEAMASGAPVLATPNGGMQEMIEDGVSGWITKSGDARALADAAMAVLALGPNRLAEAGAHAAQRIRSICAEGIVVPKHLAMRERLRTDGADRSIYVAAALPWVPVVELAVPARSGVLAAATRSALADPIGTARTLAARIRDRWRRA